jgi:hypothetical protein
MAIGGKWNCKKSHMAGLSRLAAAGSPDSPSSPSLSKGAICTPKDKSSARCSGGDKVARQSERTGGPLSVAGATLDLFTLELRQRRSTRCVPAVARTDGGVPIVVAALVLRHEKTTIFCPNSDSRLAPLRHSCVLLGSESGNGVLVWQTGGYVR